MGHAILMWRMFNTRFLFLLYKLQVMKVFLSSPQHDIIASGVIINPNILRDCIAFMHPPPPVAAGRLLIALEHMIICLSLSNDSPPPPSR